MRNNIDISVIIKLKDQLSGNMKKVATSFRSAGMTLTKTSQNIDTAIRGVSLANLALVAGFAVATKSIVSAASEYEKAMLGITSVAESFNISADEATMAAQSLASDGLMSVKDAATGLKNLLATGFSLPQAIDLMNAFKDSAAFNRQGTLEFGQAIVGATQGLKNQNSIMVDNAGITKNLSNILKEAGLSASELGNVTSDANVRLALYNGILKEASIFSGDAAKATETFDGKMSALKTRAFELKVAIGEELLPIITQFINGLIVLTEKISVAVNWLKQNQDAVRILAGMVVGALVPAMYSLATSIVAVGVALAPLIAAGAGFALLYNLLDRLVKEKTGFSYFEQLTALIQIVSNAVSNLVNWFQRLYEKAKAALNMSSKASERGGSSHQFGGIVPGPIGKPVLATVHGGEEVIPTFKQSSSGSSGSTSNISLNVYLGMYAGSETEKRNIAEALYSKLVEIARSQNKTVEEYFQPVGGGLLIS